MLLVHGAISPVIQAADEGAEYIPITDPRMTRFWITRSRRRLRNLMFPANERWGDFCTQNSFGKGNIWPGYCAKYSTRIVGIQWHEKIHEIMVPEDDVERTVEFTDFFLITPAIRFFDGRKTSLSLLQERRFKSKLEAGYQSDSNPHYLDVKGLRALISRG